MVFSSHIFLFYFLPFALLLYALSPRVGKHLLLTLVSYLFYAWANPWFVFLMLFSTVVSYLCGLWMLRAGSNTRVRKTALLVAILACLSPLGFFKYIGFVQENLNFISDLFGGPTMQVFMVILPVGISFYTFQAMSYVIDLYRGDARPARSFIDFACYVSMFPQLVAGPIIRYQDIADQLVERQHTLEKFSRGIFFFMLGFSKKILLANPMGEVADATFAAPQLTALDAWFGVMAYAFQIYFDFSAYSDMAIGLGMMLGFRFIKNFDSPYKSQSITEFWRRWHISLSNWLRDYLYIPLGGNRKGRERTYVNLMMVMLIGGLWHGATWNFVIWGGIHGLWLALERVFGKKSFYAKAPMVLRVLLTFFIVNVAWVFFRAPDLATSMSYLSSMFGLAGGVDASAVLIRGIIYTPEKVIFFFAAALIAFFGWQTWDLSKNLSFGKMAYGLIIFLWAIAAYSTQTFNPFLYFQF